MQRVKDQPHLVRTEANVIENIDQEAYQAYMARRRAVSDTKTRLDKLEQDTTDIKETLNAILQYLKNNKDDGK
jgi:hypothetical protein